MKMGDFGSFLGCWGGKCFTVGVCVLCWGVVSFTLVMVLGFVREKVHPAWLDGDKIGTKLSQCE